MRCQLSRDVKRLKACLGLCSFFLPGTWLKSLKRFMKCLSMSPSVSCVYVIHCKDLSWTARKMCPFEVDSEDVSFTVGATCPPFPPSNSLWFFVVVELWNLESLGMSLPWKCQLATILCTVSIDCLFLFFWVQKNKQTRVREKRDQWTDLPNSKNASILNQPLWNDAFIMQTSEFYHFVIHFSDGWLEPNLIEELSSSPIITYNRELERWPLAYGDIPFILMPYI